MSLRSKSPEDSSSLLSASAGSLDSILNQSREEEEIRVLMDHNADNDTLVLDNDISDIAGMLYLLVLFYFSYYYKINDIRCKWYM